MNENFFFIECVKTKIFCHRMAIEEGLIEDKYTKCIIIRNYVQGDIEKLMDDQF